MRLLALQNGALAPRDMDGATVSNSPPGYVSADPGVGAARMRSPAGIFGNTGRVQSSASMSAQNLLDNTMAQNARDPSMQPLPTNPPISMPPRAGMAFRGQLTNPSQRYGGGYDPASGTLSLSAGQSAPPPTVVPGLDGLSPLNTSPSSNIAAADVQGRIHPKFFQHGGVGEKILGGLGEFAIRYSASQGDPAALMTLRQRAEADQAQREQQAWLARHQITRNDTLDDREYEDNKPRYFSGASDQVEYDPTTGATNRIYDAPRPEQEYASQFGAPGTPAYQRAMQDYVLKSWGQTAMDARTQLSDDRFQQRLQLKQTPTYSNLHPRAPAPRAPRAPTTGTVQAGIMQKVASGAPLTAGEQDIYNTWKTGRYRGRSGSSGGGGVTEGTIITNPQTRQRMVLKGGQWVAL